MNKVKALYGVLAKNAEMKVPKNGPKGSMYTALGIIALSCIMIPCCIIVGFVSYVMTQALIAAGSPTGGLLAQLHIISAFSVVFGMLVIFNIMFFSSDREHLVPLPFKSHEILLAKFLYAYMAESVMEFLVLIAMFIGFFAAYGVSLTGILCAVAGVLLIPLLPMVYCAIIGLVMLVLLRGVRNGKIFGHISTVLLLFFVGLFLYSFKGMGGITVENYVESIAGNTNLFTGQLNCIFFTVPVLLNALGNESIFSLILYILLNLISVAVMVLLGKYTYADALYTVARLGSKKKKKDNFEKYLTKKSVFRSYVKKECSVLFGTKAYAGNCVYINLIWPGLLILYIIWNNKKESLTQIASLFAQGKDRAYIILMVLALVLAFVASAMNSLASTGFTREGRHLELIKYIPVPYKIQLSAKMFTAFILTVPSLIACDIVVVLYLKLNLLWILILTALQLLCLVITTVLGLYLDSSHPHTLWDDEYSALRGNLNGFFDMALVMVISGLISLGAILFNAYFGWSTLTVAIYLFVILLVMAAYAVGVGIKKILINMDNL